MKPSRPLSVLSLGLLTAILSGCVTDEPSNLREDQPTVVTPPPVAPTPSTPAMTPTLVPSPQTCGASKARTWHQEFQETDYPAASLTFTGTDASEEMNVQIDYDENRAYLLVKDTTANTQLYALGQRILLTNAGTTTEYRDVGTPSYANRFLDDLDAQIEDPASDWFTTPTSALTSSCTSYGGSAAYRLAFTGASEQEEWMWDTSGNLLYASFKRPSTGTDVRVTMTATFVPIAPAVAQAKGARITYTVLNTGTSGQYATQALQVSDDFHSYYSQVTIDLYSGETLVAELTPANDWSAPEGTVSIEDRGQLGILDDGDVLGIALAAGVDGYLFYDGWSETYFEEYEVEGGGEQLALEPETGGETIARHYEWQFDGSDYTFDLTIPLNVLEYYEAVDFTYRADGSHNYAAYVATQYDDQSLQAIADELLRLGREHGYTDDESVSNALAFIQSLPYTSDSVTTGFNEYPRYPLLTLADNGGDCEDTAILFAAIVQAMGYDAVLLNPPGHMATGVKVDSTFIGTTYSFQGDRWAYSETTGDGWRIGQIPNEYKTANAKILSLEPQAAPVIDGATVQAKSQGYYPVHIEFANDGTAGTVGGRVTVYGMNAARTLYYDSSYCSFTAIEAGASYTCDLKILADNRVAAFQVVLKTNDGYFAKKDF